MKNHSLLLLICLAAVSTANAEGGPSGKTLASTMDIYVFPKEAQAADQQSKDEASCYEWAVGNSGSDPFELQQQQVAQAEQTAEAIAAAEQTGQGAGARGAVRGAVAGAVIGEIVDDDASDGAAIGAAAGAIRSRRRARAAQAEATEAAEQQGQAKQQATADQIDNFKKAFSVCLEAKDYLVKY
jgi:hypothetical protein